VSSFKTESFSLLCILTSAILTLLAGSGSDNGYPNPLNELELNCRSQQNLDLSQMFEFRISVEVLGATRPG
jgi:hypothetical protein